MGLRKHMNGLGVLSLAIGCLAFTHMALADSMSAKACYAQFRAEKKAGTLSVEDYKTYKVEKCGISSRTAQSEAKNATPSQSAESSDQAVSKTSSSTRPAVAVPVPTGVVLPAAIAAKYASMSAGKARMQTCLDQYRANKANGGNGSLKWIQRGGGYYSVCSRHLKSKS